MTGVRPLYGVAAINAAKRSCDYGHPFDRDNTYRRPLGRECRKCARRRSAEFRARQRAIRLGLAA